jgi:NADP-dependent aldehyde dehydrogenase
LTLVHGFEAGVELVKHPLTAAVGFTGSVRGGRALFDAAAARPHPIPFHGELGSLNPVVVTADAAAERAETIGEGLAGSMTLGSGQFCTKPGFVLVPEGADGDRLLESLRGALAKAPQGPLLDGRMREAFLAGVAARTELDGVQAPSAPGEGSDDGSGEGSGDGSGSGGAELTVAAGFLTVPAEKLQHPGYELLTEECFGPVTVVARYGGEDEITATLSRLPGNLTASLHLSAAESAGEGGTGARLLAAVTPLAGRVLVDGWPTGVAVAPAQHHGGPYPAATSTSTSVGATAVGRWLRPVAYQDTPEPLLPPELREDNPLGLPRRVDGRWERGGRP